MNQLEKGSLPHGGPRPPKGSKNGTPPKMAPLLHRGTYGISKGFHFLDPLGGLGSLSKGI